MSHFNLTFLFLTKTIFFYNQKYNKTGLTTQDMPSPKAKSILLFINIFIIYVRNIFAMKDLYLSRVGALSYMEIRSLSLYTILTWLLG